MQTTSRLKTFKNTFSQHPNAPAPRLVLGSISGSPRTLTGALKIPLPDPSTKPTNLPDHQHLQFPTFRLPGLKMEGEVFIIKFRVLFFQLRSKSKLYDIMRFGTTTAGFNNIIYI